MWMPGVDIPNSSILFIKAWAQGFQSNPELIDMVILACFGDPLTLLSNDEIAGRSLNPPGIYVASGSI